MHLQEKSSLIPALFMGRKSYSSAVCLHSATLLHYSTTTYFRNKSVFGSLFERQLSKQTQHFLESEITFLSFLGFLFDLEGFTYVRTYMHLSLASLFFSFSSSAS